MKLRDIIREIQITKTWDLDKPGVDATKIKVGDILTFTLFEPYVEKVKQRVIEVKPGIATPLVINAKDIKPDGSDGNEDLWDIIGITNYYKKTIKNER